MTAQNIFTVPFLINPSVSLSVFYCHHWEKKRKTSFSHLSWRWAACLLECSSVFTARCFRSSPSWRGIFSSSPVSPSPGALTANWKETFLLLDYLTLYTMISINFHCTDWLTILFKSLHTYFQLKNVSEQHMDTPHMRTSSNNCSIREKGFLWTHLYMTLHTSNNSCLGRSQQSFEILISSS